MKEKLNFKNPFKEKRSIKEELKKSLENNYSLNASLIAKKVGISIYRVNKYCKNHGIDLRNYQFQDLEKPPIKSPTKSKNKKIILNVPIQNKINLDKFE